MTEIDQDDTDAVIQKLKEVDDNINKTIESEYTRVPYVPKHWWTEEIHHANVIVCYWLAQVSFTQNNIKTTDTI